MVRADQTLALLAPGKPNARADARNELSQAIRAAQQKNPEQAVVIAGDKKVKYEAVLKVMDELQQQQVKRIGLLVATDRQVSP
jgi:biopolymer transport protein TolR